MSGLQFSSIFIAAIYGILIGLIVFFIAARFTRDGRSAAKRKERIIGSGIGAEAVLQKKRKKGKSLFTKKTKDSYVEKRSLTDKIGEAIMEELLSANIMMKPEEFATLWLVVTFVPAGLVSMFSSNIVIPFLLAVGGAVGPIIYIQAKKKQRTSAFEDQLADALIIAANSLRSGLTFQQAMETISRDMFPPISEEFARAVNEMNMGVSIDDALDNICKRIKSADFKIVAVAISVQRTTGGNLSKILQTISDTIKDRAALKNEVKSATATGRMSGLVVGLMPIAITFVLNVASPGYLDPLFSSPAGKAAVFTGIVLEIIGLLAIRKITTIKF